MSAVEQSDTEKEILLKLDQILEVVQDLQARQREMAESHKSISQRAHEQKQD